MVAHIKNFSTYLYWINYCFDFTIYLLAYQKKCCWLCKYYIKYL